LTATIYKHQLAGRPPTEPSANRRWAPSVYFLALAFVACQLTGMAALARSYSIAQTTLSNTSEFTWFWLGMFLLELPIAALIARRITPQNTRTALLVLYGFVSYAPKLLRNPAGPIYHDEFAHWRETYEILATGKLFQTNPIISIIDRYPGMHAATAELVRVTGLNIWQSALLLLIVCHVALVIGIAALAQSLGLSDRTTALIAILYGLNSSFLYFDTQYGYESMAIALVVWSLVAYVRAIRSAGGRGRLAWSVMTAVLSAGTVVTHHLSTFTLVLVMALLSLAVSVPALSSGGGAKVGRAPGYETHVGWPEGWVRRDDFAHSGRTAAEVRGSWVPAAATAWSLTLLTAVMATAWFHFVAPSTWSYLSPFLGEGFSELMQVVAGSGGARQLFGASLSPWWEQKSAYLVPVFALCAVLGGLLVIRAQIRNGSLPRGRRRALLIGFTVLGLVYFPSTIFILSPSGAEGARRSWAFTWIGLCLLAGPAVVWLLDWVGRRTHRWLQLTLRMGLIAALTIALVGGTSAGLDASSRFPGPFLFGSDARSVTPELLAASTWFETRFGPNDNVVTDRYSGLVFGSFGLQNPAAPSAGFPVYNLYLAKPGAPIEPAYLLFDMSLSRYTYLIVDERMGHELPELGMYFTPNDPVSLRPHGTRPAFYGRLGKFNTIKWMIKVFQSDNYAIYRLVLPATQNGYRHQPPRARGKFLVTP
jgi:hypothetical protein